jgi:hypothetical protein
MPNPNEIVEVAIGVVDGANTLFQTSRAFFPNSTSVYINGQLRVAPAPDGWNEVDALTGLVQLKVAPVPTDSVQIAYTDATFKPLFNDEAKPVHVRELKGGDQLRIAMKAGMQMEPNFDKTAQSPAKSRRARGYSRTTFYAYLISNDPINGKMVVNYQDFIVGGNYFTATVEYKSILYLQRVVSRGRPVVETAPKKHPGAKALGTRMAQLFQQPYLVPVLFVGS